MGELDGSASALYDSEATFGIQLAEQVLAPLRLADFVSDFMRASSWFETEPIEPRALLISRSSPGHFGALLGDDFVERVVAKGASTRSIERRPPRNHADISLLTRVSVGGQLRTGKWGSPDAALTLAEVDAQFGLGFTVLVNDADLRDSRLAELCAALERSLKLPVNANVYASPAGPSGFEAHVDEMDVLVLQLRGAKAWTVYEPFLPLTDAERKFAPPLELLATLPALRLTLRPGDVLYLPRGFPHEAATADGSARSTHVTLGVLSKGATWAGLVHGLLDVCAHSRASCPASALAALAGSPACAAGLSSGWLQLLHAAVGAVTWGNGTAALALRRLLPTHEAGWELSERTTRALEAALRSVGGAPLELPLQAWAWSQALAGSENGRADPHALRPSAAAAWGAIPALPTARRLELDAELRSRLSALADAAGVLAPLAAQAMARVHAERVRVRQAARRVSLERHEHSSRVRRGNRRGTRHGKQAQALRVGVDP